MHRAAAGEFEPHRREASVRRRDDLSQMRASRVEQRLFIVVGLQRDRLAKPADEIGLAELDLAHFATIAIRHRPSRAGNLCDRVSRA